MNVWLITTGEPLPSSDERPHRTGILSKMLIDKGHKVTWWTTTFDHQKKSYIKNNIPKEDTSNNMNVEMLHSNTAYYKNISLKRMINHIQVSKDFELRSKLKRYRILFFVLIQQLSYHIKL